MLFVTADGTSKTVKVTQKTSFRLHSMTDSHAQYGEHISLNSPKVKVNDSPETESPADSSLEDPNDIFLDNGQQELPSPACNKYPSDQQPEEVGQKELSSLEVQSPPSRLNGSADNGRSSGFPKACPDQGPPSTSKLTSSHASKTPPPSYHCSSLESPGAMPESHPLNVSTDTVGVASDGGQTQHNNSLAGAGSVEAGTFGEIRVLDGASPRFCSRTCRLM